MAIGDRLEEKRRQNILQLEERIEDLPPGLQEQYRHLRATGKEDILQAFTEGVDQKRGRVPGAEGSFTERTFGPTRVYHPQRDQIEKAYLQMMVDLERYRNEAEANELRLKTRANAQDSTRAFWEASYLEEQKQSGEIAKASVQEIGKRISSLEDEREELLSGKTAALLAHLGEEGSAQFTKQINSVTKAWNHAIQAETNAARRAGAPAGLSWEKSREWRDQNAKTDASARAAWRVFSDRLGETLGTIPPEHRDTVISAVSGHTQARERELKDGATYETRHGKAQAQDGPASRYIADMKKRQGAKTLQLERMDLQVRKLKEDQKKAGQRRTGRYKPPEGQEADKEVIAAILERIESGEPFSEEEWEGLEQTLEEMSLSGQGIPRQIIAQAMQSAATLDPETETGKTLRSQLEKYTKDPDDPMFREELEQMETQGPYQAWVEKRGYTGADKGFQRRAFFREMGTIDRAMQRNARAAEAANILSGVIQATPAQKARAAIRSMINKYYVPDRSAEALDPDQQGKPGEEPVSTVEDATKVVAEAAPDSVGELEKEAVEGSFTAPDPAAATDPESDWGKVVWHKDPDGTIWAEKPDGSKLVVKSTNSSYDQLNEKLGWEPAQAGEVDTGEVIKEETAPTPDAPPPEDPDVAAKAEQVTVRAEEADEDPKGILSVLKRRKDRQEQTAAEATEPEGGEGEEEEAEVPEDFENLDPSWWRAEEGKDPVEPKGRLRTSPVLYRDRGQPSIGRRMAAEGSWPLDAEEKEREPVSGDSLLSKFMKHRQVPKVGVPEDWGPLDSQGVAPPHISGARTTDAKPSKLQWFDRLKRAEIGKEIETE